MSQTHFANGHIKGVKEPPVVMSDNKRKEFQEMAQNTAVKLDMYEIMTKEAQHRANAHHKKSQSMQNTQSSMRFKSPPAKSPFKES